MNPFDLGVPACDGPRPRCECCAGRGWVYCHPGDPGAVEVGHAQPVRICPEACEAARRRRQKVAA